MTRLFSPIHTNPLYEHSLVPSEPVKPWNKNSQNGNVVIASNYPFGAKSKTCFSLNEASIVRESEHCYARRYKMKDDTTAKVDCLRAFKSMSHNDERNSSKGESELSKFGSTQR